MVQITEIEPNASHSTPTATDASSSHSYGKTKKLGLGHRIFLSHSGADKDFVKDLYEDLIATSYDPFFDVESLPKAEIVTMGNILEEAVNCRLGVFVLSEEFFVRNKNPMLELAICVDAQVRLLPLFFGLSVGEFKDENRRKQWLETWRKWEDEEVSSSKKKKYGPMEEEVARKVDISKWEKALRVLGDTNGIEYAKVAVSKREYIAAVVKEICQLLPPDVGWDDSKVKGKERLYKVVEEKFAATQCAALGGARVVGFYGIGGSGKTTLCTTLLNFYFPEFQGKVCHVELDSTPSPTEDQDVLKRLKKILTRLTKVSPRLVELVKDPREARALLQKHIHDNKVFLAIDNVQGTNKSMEEAESYLTSGFESGSKILITARSREILGRLTRHDKSCVLAHIPDLQQGEATKIFRQKTVHLSHPDPDREPQLTMEQYNIVYKCVDLCHVKKGGKQGKHYHPLMLVSFAAMLGEISSDPCEWRSTLEDLNCKRSRGVDIDEVFTVLRSSYDALNQEKKQMFLDIALYVPENARTDKEIYEWLRFVHDRHDFDMKQCLRELRRRSLLNNSWSQSTDADPWGSFSVHDLYKDLARQVANEDASCKSIFLEECEVRQDVLSRMLSHKSKLLERVGFVNCKFKFGVLNLGEYPGIKVLQLVRNGGLADVMLGHATIFLRSLEVQSAGTDMKVRIQGLQNGCYLGWLRLENCVFRDRRWFLWPFSRHNELDNLRALRCVEVQGIGPVQLRRCIHLERLRISDSRGKLQINHYTKLRDMVLHNCDVVEMDLSSLTNLARLAVDNCSKLVRLDGLANLRSGRLYGCQALEKIDIRAGAALQLDDAGSSFLSNWFLVESCDNLREIYGLGG